MQHLLTIDRDLAPTDETGGLNLFLRFCTVRSVLLQSPMPSLTITISEPLDLNVLNVAPLKASLPSQA